MDNYQKYIKQQLKTFDKTPPILDWRTEMKNPKSNKALLDMVPIPGPTRDVKPALDIGAGAGYHTEDLRKMGYNAFGIELSQKRVNDAHKMGRNYVSQGDFHSLDHYGSDMFRLVFAHEAVEHSYEPRKVFDEVYRVLKSGGVFVFSCPLEGCWRKPQSGGAEHNLDINDNHPWKPNVFMLNDMIKSVGFINPTIKLYELDKLIHRMDWTVEKGNDFNFRPHAHCIVTK